MFDFVWRPVRSVAQALSQDALKPLEETERETLNAIKAIDRATESIEHHVEVIETLATSVGPLTESVDRLNETVRDLVAALAPIVAVEHEVRRAEQGVEQVERVFRFRRHKNLAEPETTAPES